MSDRYQDGQACPFPHHARGAEHLHGDLLEGEHRRPRLRHDRQEEADTLPQGIEAVNSTTTLLYHSPTKIVSNNLTLTDNSMVNIINCGNGNSEPRLHQQKDRLFSNHIFQSLLRQKL